MPPPVARGPRSWSGPRSSVGMTMLKLLTLGVGLGSIWVCSWGPTHTSTLHAFRSYGRFRGFLASNSGQCPTCLNSSHICSALHMRAYAALPFLVAHMGETLLQRWAWKRFRHLEQALCRGVGRARGSACMCSQYCIGKTAKS